jgi:DNA-binding PadR family transcriptional regulator
MLSLRSAPLCTQRSLGEIPSVPEKGPQLNQGTIYASLVRLQQRGRIASKWGISDDNRKAKFYSITKAGQKQLARDTAYWQRLAEMMGHVLAMQRERSEP